MSETMTSALPGAAFDGLVSIREAGLCGMITLRGAPDTLAGPLAEVTGLVMPETRRVVTREGRTLAWMSPDEFLLMLPHAEARATTAALSDALAGRFATVADVSDARAVFRLEGAKTPDVLAKLCPVDFATLAPGEIRRTRAGQIAAAILVERTDAMQVICFRSVARYLFDALSIAASPDADPALYG